MSGPLGALQFVMELTLDDNRRLAQADPVRVRAELAERGYYLQVPPSVKSLMPRHND
ncbi:MAG: Protein YcgL [Stenotrophomonas maltophilia]|uniref:Protein YcgL n=1 Tax=Stenotrophomonas maltophilia TaxID=40324 RepID=A0A7V8JK67_STEMA|nr:MAG: Protein YcgL [Stenotrophomonas maltophilia]